MQCSTNAPNRAKMRQPSRHQHGVLLQLRKHFRADGASLPRRVGREQPAQAMPRIVPAGIVERRMKAPYLIPAQAEAQREISLTGT